MRGSGFGECRVGKATISVIDKLIDDAAHLSKNKSRFKLVVLKHLTEVMIHYEKGFDNFLGWTPDHGARATAVIWIG